MNKDIREYLKKYSQIFTPYEKKEILDFARYGTSLNGASDVIREVYDELNLLPSEDNLFLGFINLLQGEFSLDNRHILEVGGGVLPRLGKRILQVNSSCKITIYDPRISIYEYDNERLSLIRRNFGKDINIKNIGVDLLVGLMPSGGSEALLNAALDNRVDFMLALGDGGFCEDGYSYYEDDDEWRHSLISYARSQVPYYKMGKLKIKNLNEYGDPYPVIYNDRNCEE